MVMAPGVDTTWLQDAVVVMLEMHDRFAQFFGLKVRHQSGTG
jgi:hypothetical protein